MIARTLDRYIALRFVKTMMAMVISLYLIIVVVDFVEQLRKASDSTEIALLDLLSLSALKAPIFVDKAFPFACLFAAMVTLSQLNQKMELVVARAAGVSAWQFLMPISVAAVLIGLFTAFVYNPVAILAFDLSKDVEVRVFNRGDRMRNAEIAGYWISQEELDGNSIINARIAREGGTRLDDVKIIRFDDENRIVERIDAESAVYEGQSWVLTNAITVGSDTRRTPAPSLAVPTRLSREVLAGIMLNADSVPFWNLRNAAGQALLSGSNANPYLVQFYSLLALPLFLVAMVLIAASVTLRFVRFGQIGRLILGGVLSGFLLYTITKIVTSLGSNGIMPPIAAAWSPSIVAILFGTTILLHQEDG